MSQECCPATGLGLYLVMRALLACASLVLIGCGSDESFGRLKDWEEPAKPARPIVKRGGSPPLPGESSGQREKPLIRAYETVTTAWRTGTTVVELVGVCSVTDNDVEAWLPSGDPNPALRRLVLGTLESSGSLETLPFQFRRKTRLVVFRMITDDDPDRQTTQFLSFDHLYDDASHLQGDVPIPEELGLEGERATRIKYFCWWVGADASAKLASIRLQHTEFTQKPSNDRNDVPIRNGARTKTFVMEDIPLDPK